MGCGRALLCILLPPLAVLDKGCGTILIVALLTLSGWVPGAIAALVVCSKDNKWSIPTGHLDLHALRARWFGCIRWLRHRLSGKHVVLNRHVLSMPCKFIHAMAFAEAHWKHLADCTDVVLQMEALTNHKLAKFYLWTCQRYSKNLTFLCEFGLTLPAHHVVQKVQIFSAFLLS
jgi:uncharacterized membrane protein YqaE (UPF0057 family)